MRTEQITNQKAQVTAWDSQASALDSQTTELDTQATVLNSQASAWDSQVTASNNQSTELNTQASGLNSQVTASNTQSTELNTQASGLNSQVTASNTQSTELDNQASVSSSQASASNNQITDLNSQARAWDTQATASNSQASDTNNQVTALNTQSTELDNQASVSSSQASASNNQITDLNSQATASDTQSTASNNQARALNTQSTVSNPQLNNLKNSIKEMNQININFSAEAFDPIYWANKADEVSKSIKPRSSVNLFSKSTAAYNCDEADRLAEIQDVTRQLVDRGIDITAGYNNWLKLGFALADGLGEDGREIYHQLSQLNDEYDTAECDRQYTHCLHGRGQGITVNTFFQMAKEAGIDLSQVAREQMRTHQVNAISANVPSAKRIEKVEKSTILGTLEEQVPRGTMAQVAQTHAKTPIGFTFSDKLKRDDLDDITGAIYDLHHDEPEKCDAMILGALNVISGLMGGANGTPEHRSGVYGIYDGRRVYAPLYNIIYSGAGNGKGNLMFNKELAYQVKKEMRSAYDAEKSKYDQAMAEWESKSKKDRGDAPREPVYRDPFVPGNSSSSAVYRALDANGGWGLMFETEADTVSSMIDSDYGNYSDLMRKAHHHETLSMNRVTEKVHIDIDEPRLSIFLTCTPGQLPSLFPSFENGLGSRFLFYNLPDEEVSFHDVFALRESPLEDTYKQLGDKLLPLYHALQSRADHPIQFMLSAAQQREFLRTYQQLLVEQYGMQGKGIRAFVFRIALESFRYAMILTTLRRLSEWAASFGPSTDHEIFRDDENALICDDRDFRTVKTIVGCLVNHTARVYAVMAKEDDNPFALHGKKLSADERRLYKALPEGDFPTADAIDTAKHLQISQRTAQRMLSRFCNVYRIIDPVKRGVYNKPAVGDNDNTNDD
ncbi:DUF3987 domain-containing protein [Segatella bryantii]|uniref:DUF3987 domain-containing protein n=1 Tax=Segatella bryantii TaxID=77095 RepID=UPI001EDA2198|nr:DUF3987 domain-containing protein [Segatella bryantii]UKK73080.1 DUF3987 domain-containing protein [Segatella bryantii]